MKTLSQFLADYISDNNDHVDMVFKHVGTKNIAEANYTSLLTAGIIEYQAYLKRLDTKQYITTKVILQWVQMLSQLERIDLEKLEPQAETINLSTKQLDIIRHTATRAANGHYNGDSEDMEILIKLDLMRDIGFKSFCEDRYYQLTKAGKTFWNRHIKK